MLRRLTFITAVALITPVEARTQEQGAVSAGDRVRITMAGSRETRTFTVVRADSGRLVLSATGSALREITGEPISVPTSSINKMAVSLGPRSRGQGARRGAGIGFLAGGVAGAIGGFAAGDDPPCRASGNSFGDILGTALCDAFRMSAGEKAAAYGLLVGGTGAVIGLVVGAMHPGERWSAMRPIRSLALGPTNDGGMRLSVSAAF